MITVGQFIITVTVLLFCTVCAIAGTLFPVILYQRSVIKDLQEEVKKIVHEYKMYHASVEGDHMTARLMAATANIKQESEEKAEEIAEKTGVTITQTI